MTDFNPDAFTADVTREKNVVEVIVPETDAGTRIDKYLTQFYPEASRTKIQRSIKKGHIKVNGADVSKSYRTEPGDAIVFRLIRKPPMTAEPEPIPLDIVYEDDDLLVVNKPAGMVVHPAPGHRSGTLVNALLHHVGGSAVAADDDARTTTEETVGLSMVNALPERPDHPVVRPGIVHRLDKGTTGVMVVAKRDAAHQHLARQFHDHTIDREYRALLWGRFDSPSGTITGAIGRDPHHRQRMAVVPPDRGKDATTQYRTLDLMAYTSVVAFTLETGRTHQIRVHAAHRNHPVFGDPTYGGTHIRYGPHGGARQRFIERLVDALGRPALHAHRLAFTHPRTGTRMDFAADWPSDMQQVREELTRVEA